EAAGAARRRAAAAERCCPTARRWPRWRCAKAVTTPWPKALGPTSRARPPRAMCARGRDYASARSPVVECHDVPTYDLPLVAAYAVHTEANAGPPDIRPNPQCIVGAVRLRLSGVVESRRR